jgi:hypothetical protein
MKMEGGGASESEKEDEEEEERRRTRGRGLRPLRPQGLEGRRSSGEDFLALALTRTPTWSPVTV